MRIIAGEAKGHTLYAPQGQDTRPTSDKIRGSIFNILGARVEDARVLDLFGGTGALALEALSRGAASAVIVDSSRQAAQAIERNARATVRREYEARVRLIRADYRSAIAAAGGEPFDLVFLDPPYRMTQAYGDALSRLLAAGALAEDCRIVMERRRGAEVALPEGFEVIDTRLYGETAVDFVKRITHQPPLGGGVAGVSGRDELRPATPGAERKD